MDAIILVPIKDPRNAKHRLAATMAPEERRALAWAMFCDLCRALESVASPIAVVTTADRAAEYAKRAGWRVFHETGQISESASIDRASRVLAREMAGGVLRLPADLPLVTARDIEAILRLNTAKKSAVLVPSRDGSGTNAVLRRPPDLFPSRFGPNSFLLHLQEAKRAQAAVTVMQNANIALDLDDPADILHFLDQPSETETYAFLIQIRMKERIIEFERRLHSDTTAQGNSRDKTRR